MRQIKIRKNNNNSKIKNDEITIKQNDWIKKFE